MNQKHSLLWILILCILSLHSMEEHYGQPVVIDTNPNEQLQCAIGDDQSMVGSIDGNEGLFSLWSCNNGKLIKTFNLGEKCLSSMANSNKNGSRVMITVNNNLENPTPVGQYFLPQRVPKGPLPANDNDIRSTVWDTETGSKIFDQNLKTTSPMCWSFISEDGQKAIVSLTNYEQGETLVYDLRNPKNPQKYSDWYNFLSHNQEMGIWWMPFTDIIIRQFPSGKEISEISDDQVKGAPQAWAWSPDNQTLATSITFGRMIDFWDIKTGELKESFNNENSDNESLYWITYLANGKKLASCDSTSDHEIKIWDLADGSHTKIPLESNANFLVTNQRFLAAALAHKILVWNFQNSDREAEHGKTES